MSSSVLSDLLRHPNKVLLSTRVSYMVDLWESAEVLAFLLPIRSPPLPSRPETNNVVVRVVTIFIVVTRCLAAALLVHVTDIRKTTVFLSVASHLSSSVGRAGHPSATESTLTDATTPHRE
jgi:hypothetical protein